MSKPGKQASPANAEDDRQARLAAELRTNLLKRKAFARAQADKKQTEGDAGRNG